MKVTQLTRDALASRRQHKRLSRLGYRRVEVVNFQLLETPLSAKVVDVQIGESGLCVYVLVKGGEDGRG